MIETLKTLCALSGVSGAEDEVREYILARVMPHADEIHTDALGNLIVFKRGRVQPQQRLLLSAHMDEVGLIVMGIDEAGFLRFAPVGGIDRRVLLGKRVFVGKERVRGVIGIKPIHLLKDAEKNSVPETDEMYIDIGAVSREDAEKRASLGDAVCFDDGIWESGGYIKAKAIDDRAGCAVMVKLIESELPCDAWFSFVTQEEVGTRGSVAAAYTVKPDAALILEGTTATDMPSIEDGKVICRAGGGVCISLMDGATIYDRGIYSALTRLAGENGIAWQIKRRIAGGTDARSIQPSNGGVRVGGLACAVRNIHSPAGVAKVSEIEDMYRLACLFLEDFAENGLK